MKIIAVTQRVDIHHKGAERRDAVDQQLLNLLNCAGYLPLTLPNNTQLAWQLLSKNPVVGFVLSGGNDLVQYGGDAPERDALETELIHHALANNTPLLGICRGMQLLLDFWGQRLQPVKGQVTQHQHIIWHGENHLVNSYHHWGSSSAPNPFQVTATAAVDDNKRAIVKAIKHREQPIYGIMWHPERISPFRDEDITFLQSVFL
ncbi:putative glutamine amidotransferase [Alteromonadaceae bacterium 2753L.S.0a.02]|nr:putative glutamine amidotransferase [Alteromonadaceae bacterium 2753L.S.0a.02]